MAKFELMALLRKVQAAIHEFEIDLDMAYKASCWGREEIASLRQQERELLAAMVMAA